MRDKIIEKIELLRKTILNDKNVNVFDKGLYCVELMDIRLDIEELELKSDLLNPVIKSVCTACSGSGCYCGVDCGACDGTGLETVC